MKKTFIMTLVLVVLAAMLTACEAATSVPVPAASAAPTAEIIATPIPEVSASPAQDDTAQTATEATAVPGAEAAAPQAQPQNDPNAFKSDYGYTISFDEDSLDYRRTEGYDEYIMRSDDINAPFVFVCVSRIGADFVDSVSASALGENPVDCTVGQAQMPAKYSELEEPWESGTIIHRSYVCPLSSGDALLIETQRYTQNGSDLYESWVTELLNSIAE